MPVQKRFKTNYPGVYYVKGTAIGTGKTEKIYYIRYRKNGKLIEEKAGRQFQNDMTPARAAQLRTRRIEGELSNKEKREALEAKRRAEEGRLTIDRLWNLYKETLTNNKTRKIDEGRYNKYLKDPLGDKEPDELLLLDVDRLRLNLRKILSPQTVKHVLTLLTRIINYGVKGNLCNPLPFHIKKPTVNNLKTEDLTPEQLKKLLDAIADEPNRIVSAFMETVLVTGMRRGELFKLKKTELDFQRRFIHIKNPKGGIDAIIPMNEAAYNLLKGYIENHPVPDSEYVFPGRGGNQRTDIKNQVNKIKDKARLPKDFRAVQGLRHTYASMLASSGVVDLYTLQKLLTHKDPRMTQRYAHLRDEALRKASEVAGAIIEDAAKQKEEKVVNLKDHK